MVLPPTAETRTSKRLVVVGASTNAHVRNSDLSMVYPVVYRREEAEMGCLRFEAGWSPLLI